MIKIKLKRKQKDVRRSQQKSKKGFLISIVHKLVPFSLSTISFIIATQKTAKDFNYDINIVGYPKFIFRGEPFYSPLLIFRVYITTAKRFNLEAGDIIYKNVQIVVWGVLLSLLFYVVLTNVRTYMNKNDKDLLAADRWGTLKDLEAVGLLNNKGVVIGQTEDAWVDATFNKESGSLIVDVKRIGTLIAFNMNVSALLIAGSRLGKGISTVIPTLLFFPYSVIVIDPKSENYSITSGWRRKFTEVYKYAPVSHDSLHFNILNEISEENTFRDANMIAEILTTPKNPNANTDPHWQKTASVLITATIMHVLCSDYETKSLYGVFEYIAQGCDENGEIDQNAMSNLLIKMIKGKHVSKGIHASIKNYASQILRAPDEERGSIFSSALEALSVFNDPIVAETSNDSDFCLDDFKYNPVPISWYLCLPFPDLDRLAPLLRLIIEFVCRKFSQDANKYGEEKLKNRILFLIDEFSSLGCMKTIENFASILNGYGISFLWIAQSKKQIDELYGPNTALYEHARFIWHFAINDHDAAEYFSKRIGEEGIIKENTSTSGNRYDYGMNNVSISSDITTRRLFTPGEIETLPANSEIIHIQGGHSYLAKKIAYYSDPRFKDKANLPTYKTRKEMLLATKTSCVIKKEDGRWYDNVPHSDEDEYFMDSVMEEDFEDESNNDIKQDDDQDSINYEAFIL